MKASELIKNLQKLIEEHGDLNLVYSTDDEGNSFDEVGFNPSFGVYDKEEKTYRMVGEKDVNVFCIN